MSQAKLDSNKIEALEKILFYKQKQKCLTIKKQKHNFIHYTNAGAAAKIITQKSLWMRNALFMPDTIELESNFNVFKEVLFSSDIKAKIQNTFKELLPNFSSSFDLFTSFFSISFEDFIKNTYISCFSEFDSNNNGNIALWRAHGRENSIGLVFHRNYFIYENQSLNATFIPVSYLSENDFINDLVDFIDNLKKNENMIKNATLEDTYIIITMIAKKIKLMLLTIKNPIFSVEKEWRLVFFSNDLLTETYDDPSKDIVFINNKPEIIHRIPLIEERKLNINKVLHKIIVGPSTNPLALKQVFSEILIDLRFPNEQIDEMVVLSKVPYRVQNS